MDVPGIVEDALDGEEVATAVDLGGEDGLYVTATRTLIYRSEGILSDESVEEYTHEAEQLSVSEGRRKTRLTLHHPVEGTQEFTLPASAADEAVPAILAGILRENGVIEAGEAVIETYLFSELTLMITEDRLVKHVGETLWDLEFEEFHFADVTGLTVEEGSVATQIVLDVDDRAQRFKTPSDRAREVRETLEDALRTYHGVRPSEDLNEALAPADADDGADEEATADDDGGGSAGGGMELGETVDPLSAGDTSDTGSNPDPLEDPRTVNDREPESADIQTSDQAAGAEQAGGGEQAEAGPDTGAAGSGDDEAADPAAAERQEQPAAQQGATEQSTPDGAGQADAESNDPAGQAQPSHTADSQSQPTQERSAAPDSERANDVFQEAGFEPAEDDESDELAEEVAELRTAVQKQNKLLARQHKTIEKLVEELRRGR